MTLPIIIHDIRHMDLSLNVVAMAIKAKAEPERVRSEAPALTHLPNILVDQVSGDFLRRKIKPRLNALENLMFPKAKRKVTAMAQALARCRPTMCACNGKTRGYCGSVPRV